MNPVIVTIPEEIAYADYLRSAMFVAMHQLAKVRPTRQRPSTRSTSTKPKRSRISSTSC